MTEATDPHGGAYPTQTNGTSDQDEDDARPADERRPGTSSTERGRNIDRDDESRSYP